MVYIIYHIILLLLTFQLTLPTFIFNIVILLKTELQITIKDNGVCTFLRFISVSYDLYAFFTTKYV